MTARTARAVFLLVLVLRIAIAAQFPGNFDSGSYLIVAKAVRSGQNVYAATDRYNYSPLWSYVVAALWAASDPNVGLFVLLAGLLQIAVDVVTAGLLLRLARDRLGFAPWEARRAALLFFSNPVSVLISCAHGQFDGLSILFLVAAVLAATGADRPRRRAGIVSFLTLSVLIKHITVFHPLLFWRRVRADGLSARLLAIPYAVFALSFVPFLSALKAIVGNVFLYGPGLSGRYAWRVAPIERVLGFSPGQFGYLALLGGAVAGAVWLGRRLELPRACLLLFLALLVFQPSFGSQYYVWPMALGSLYPSPGYVLCATAAALFESGSEQSLALPWPFVIRRLVVWLTALLWLALEVYRSMRPAGAGSSGSERLRAEATAPAPSPAP
jgi:hypothetical protein